MNNVSEYDIDFTSILPNPIRTKNGESVMLSVEVMASKKIESAVLVVTNNQPSVLEIFDNNENSSTLIHSDSIQLNKDYNLFTYQIGFNLIKNTDPAGRVVGLTLCIKDSKTSTPLSVEKQILCTIKK